MKKEKFDEIVRNVNDLDYRRFGRSFDHPQFPACYYTQNDWCLKAVIRDIGVRLEVLETLVKANDYEFTTEKKLVKK